MVTKGGYRDTVLGATVVLTAAVLLGLVYAKDDRPEQGETDGYILTALFKRADGIGVGSLVRLSGVNVGKVVDQKLAPDYRARLTLHMEQGVEVTADTAAVIQTDGLLGAKYIELKPGGDERMLEPGQEIAFTQDAMVLEELVGMIIEQAKAKRGYAGKPVPSLTE